MKIILLVAAACLLSAVSCDEKYSTKFKNIDLDEILKNERLVNAYFKCLNEGENCTPEGDELRKILPDAIATGCEKCTEEQKNGARKVSQFLIKEKPELWNELIEKYDPENMYREKYKEQLKSAGFEI